MTREIIDILKNLRENPSNEKVDHILLLNQIYTEYSNGINELEPIAQFYLNGFDDLPSLKEKHLWNEQKFNELRAEFAQSHKELINLIDLTIEKVKIIESDSFEYQLSKSDFLRQVQSGEKHFEEIDLENMDLRNEILSGLTFWNCFISADFRGSDLSGTKFINSNIKTSDFRNANLTNGLMENVLFEATRFKGAKTKGFIFTNNSCHSATGIGQNEFNDWIIEME